MSKSKSSVNLDLVSYAQGNLHQCAGCFTDPDATIDEHGIITAPAYIPSSALRKNLYMGGGVSEPPYITISSEYPYLYIDTKEEFDAWEAHIQSYIVWENNDWRIIRVPIYIDSKRTKEYRYVYYFCITKNIHIGNK